MSVSWFCWYDYEFSFIICHRLNSKNFVPERETNSPKWWLRYSGLNLWTFSYHWVNNSNTGSPLNQFSSYLNSKDGNGSLATTMDNHHNQQESVLPASRATVNIFFFFFLHVGPREGSKSQRRRFCRVHVTLRWLKIRTVQFFFNFSSKYPSRVKTLRWLTFLARCMTSFWSTFESNIKE